MHNVAIIYACSRGEWPHDVVRRPLYMPAIIPRDPGGLGISKTPSFATTGDRLAEKRRLHHNGIGKSVVFFNRYSTVLTYLFCMLGGALMEALDQKGTMLGCGSQIKAEITGILTCCLFCESDEYNTALDAL